MPRARIKLPKSAGRQVAALAQRASAPPPDVDLDLDRIAGAIVDRLAVPGRTYLCQWSRAEAQVEVADVLRAMIGREPSGR